MSKPICISYVRFSTPEQARGSSIKRQLEESRKYAQENGLQIDEKYNYRDEGLSAHKSRHKDRGAFGKLLDLIRSDEIPKGSVLLVESLDRISREKPLTALATLSEIIDHDIAIVTTMDKQRYDKETIDSDYTKVLYAVVIAARAYDESLSKSIRLSDVWERKRRNINTIKATSVCPNWLKLSKDKKSFLIDSQKAEIVRKIFELSKSGNGVATIARILNENNVPTFSNKKRKNKGWNPSYVSKILHSRAVIGEFQPHKMVNGKRMPLDEIISDYFPKIIDSTLFNAVQARFANKKKYGGKTGKISNLFSGIAYCGDCKAPMHIVNKGKPPKGYTYLVCSNALRAVKCEYNALRYDEIEKAFVEYCAEIDFFSVLNGVKNDAVTQIENLESEKFEKTSKIKHLKKRLKEIESTYLDPKNETSSDYFIDFASKTNEEISRKKSEIHLLSDKINKLKLTIENGCDIEKNFEKYNEIMNGDLKKEDIRNFRMKLRNEIKNIVSSVTFYPKGINQIEPSRNHRCFKIKFNNGNYRLFSYDSVNSSYMMTVYKNDEEIEWMYDRKNKKYKTIQNLKNK